VCWLGSSYLGSTGWRRTEFQTTRGLDEDVALMIVAARRLWGATDLLYA
jgi:hypothetical protein